MKMLRNIMIFFPIFLVNGCINYEQKVYLYEDGTGTMEIHYWMKATDRLSLATISTLPIFNTDSIKKEFESPFVNIQNLVSYVDSNDTSIHTKIYFDFTNIDSLNTIQPFSQHKFSLTDGATGQKVFSQFIPPIGLAIGSQSQDFYVKYIYQFHGKIILHNATLQDKNMLTWEYKYPELGTGKTISVTFQPYKIKETPFWIYILAGLIFTVVIFYLFRKKRD